MDSRFAGFQGTRPWSQEYKLFRSNRTIVDSYHQPVYINELGDNTYDIIFYTGRVSYQPLWLAIGNATDSADYSIFDSQYLVMYQRWALTYSAELSQLFPNENGTNVARNYLANWFSTSFHAHWVNFTLSFISEPMDL